MGFLTQSVVVLGHAAHMLKKFTTFLHLVAIGIVYIYNLTLDYNTLAFRKLGNVCFP
jgi:hypothetical protein